MNEENSGRKPLTEDDLLGSGKYAIGYSKYRIVVALPKSSAEAVTKYLRYLEFTGIVLFIISAILFFLNRIGTDISFRLASAVIGFRFIVIILNRFVIAQTERITETTDELPEIEGDGHTSSFQEVLVQANINDGKLTLELENQSLYEVVLTVSVKAEQESVNIFGNRRAVELPTVHLHEKRVTRQETCHRMEFNLENINPSTTGADRLLVSISGTRDNVDDGKMERLDEQKFVIPFSISNLGEIVTESYIYKIVSD